MEHDSIPHLGAEPTRWWKEYMPIGSEGNEVSARKGKARVFTLLWLAGTEENSRKNAEMQVSADKAVDEWC